jgi:DeoR family fructose operon transcriptional repressor
MMPVETASTSKRREEILEIITRQKRVEVAYLKDKFDVSSVTIGKDLMYLEAEGLIHRHFGYVEARSTDLFKQRDGIQNYEKKKKIAKHALNYIEDGISVFFYMSSTILTMVRMLKDLRNLNVLTNSIEVAHDITLNLGLRAIVLGGYYSPDFIATFGDMAVSQFNQYNIDKTFFTCNGVSAEGGLTIDEPFEKDLNIAMVRYSNKKYLLAEGRKIGKTSFVKFAPVKEIDVLITDSDADTTECEKIRALGVEVIIV